LGERYGSKRLGENVTRRGRGGAVDVVCMEDTLFGGGAGQAALREDAAVILLYIHHKIVTGHVSPTSKMVNMVPIDGEEDVHLVRSSCNPKPSAELLNHPEQASVSSEQQAIETFRAARATRRAVEIQITLEVVDAANPISSPTRPPSRDNSPVVHLGLMLRCRRRFRVQKQECICIR
jgi:hypothetical protein